MFKDYDEELLDAFEAEFVVLEVLDEELPFVEFDDTPA